MKDFTKTKSEKSAEKNKSKWGLKNLISSGLLVIGTLGILYWISCNSESFKINRGDKRAYWFEIRKIQFPFTIKNFNSFKFDLEKKLYVSFYQKKFLRKAYYCLDDKGESPMTLDGLADKVKIGEEKFIREKDYYSNEEIFHKADQNIAKVHNVLRKEFPEYDEITQTQP